MSTKPKSESTMTLLLAAVFIVYMYFLIRIIVFKGAPFSLQSLWEQAGRMLEHPDKFLSDRATMYPLKRSRGG